ncbi:hypothetical protein C2W62_28130 [Candidatus Entotheonella serta]|nr:hypothetical protein C2W62_28130 [Candidatus Entotheonella serta]
MAGLIKVLLCMKHGVIPAGRPVQEMNSAIDFEDLGLNPVLSQQPWDHTVQHWAGINSFGFGGTNAHAIIGSWPMGAEVYPSDRQWTGDSIFPLSARSKESLTAKLGQILTYVDQHDDVSLADMVTTSWEYRSHLPFRMAVTVNSLQELKAALEAFKAGEASEDIRQGRGDQKPKVGFVFSGNGCQWYAMGQQADLNHAGFGQSLARVDQLLQPLLGWSVCEEIQRPKAQSRIAFTEVGQPVLFAIQVAIVDVLRQVGVVCEAVCGHSVGEVAAAWCAGLVDLPTACRIIVCRSRLQGLTHGDGGMAALAIDPMTAFSYIEGCRVYIEGCRDVHLAAVNSPKAVSLSGDIAELQRIVALAKADGHRAVVLELPYAFHSPHMDALRGQLLEDLGTIESHPSLCAFHSTVGSCHDGVQVAVMMAFKR